MKRNRNNDNDRRKRKQDIRDMFRQIKDPDKPCGACKTPEPHPDFTFPDSAPDDVRTIIAHMRTERTEQVADEVITIPREEYDILIATRALASSARALCKRTDIIANYQFGEILQVLFGVEEKPAQPARANTDAESESA